MLPNEVVAVQVLRLHAGTDIQCSGCGQDSVGAKACGVGIVVGDRGCAEEVVHNLEEGGLLQPSFTGSGTAAEEAGAADCVAGDGTGESLYTRYVLACWVSGP